MSLGEKGSRSRKIRDVMVRSGEMIEAREGETMRLSRDGAKVIRSCEMQSPSGELGPNSGGNSRDGH